MRYRNLIDADLLIYQNPVVLAYLIYYFLNKFSNEKKPCDLSLLYYVTPILLIDDYYKILKNTQLKSGIEKFITKFIDNKSRDVLLRLKYEAKRCFKLTSKAIYIGHVCELFSVDRINAQVSIQNVPGNLPRIPIALRCRFRDAEKLGSWLAKHSGFEAVSLLRQDGV